MIDEKKVISKIEKRIDKFVKEHPKLKDCEQVQVQREFIQMLEAEAKEQNAKETLRSEHGNKCELYDSCLKCAITEIANAVKKLEDEQEYSYANFDEYVEEIAPYLDAEYNDRFCDGIQRAIGIIRTACRKEEMRRDNNGR